MICIALVEDNAQERTRIGALVRKTADTLGEKITLFPFDSADALFKYKDARFDLILLDIQLPGTDGMTAAQRIREADEDVMLVFITSMAQYALQGYQVDALDFIVKPVSEPILTACLSRAFRRLAKAAPACLNIKTGAAYRRLNIAAIAYAEAQSHRVYLHAGEETILYPGSLAALEAELAPHGFFRCHSAFLVRLGAIEHIEGSDARIGSALIPISKHRRRDFLTALTSYWGGNL